MTIADIRLIIMEAYDFKQKSTDNAFRENLQSKINTLVTRIRAIKKATINQLSADEEVPQEIIEASNELKEYCST